MNSRLDKSNSFKDTPNDYTQLDVPETLRFIRYRNVKMPMPSLAISEIRVFGNGTGKAPQKVKSLKLVRQADKRDIDISWTPVKGAQGYNILWGVAPDKLYSSWMVYDNNELFMKSLTVGQDYYFCIEAFNENGVSERTPVQHVE